MVKVPGALPVELAERFAIVARYGGGEGATFAVQPRAGGPRQVLKVLPDGVEPAEASLLLSLRHPAIPAVLEVGRLRDGRAFVRREHAAGEVLRTLPRDPAELRTRVQQLLEVLAFVHLRGIVHLDLKPANLVLGPDGSLHLLDFGMSARRGGRGVGGTPFFAAPEQLLGALPDQRADLFAVGAMVAQALWPGGEVPLARFVASFPAQDFFAAAGITADALPPPFDRFVLGCVAVQPARRFPDAQAALEFLCGSTGRPALSLLAPDPVELFAPELLRAGEGDAHLVLRGGAAADRRALAMHLAATASSVRAVHEGPDELRIARLGPAERVIELPPLAPARIARHLQQAAGLQPEAAGRAAAWLATRGASSGDAVRRELAALVDAGEIVPAGTRWSWPAAQSGRVAPSPTLPDWPTAPTPELVRSAAARGQRERALALWTRGAATAPATEEAVRRALAEGLLDGGEPAQALPFCSLWPELRAQALLDTGQIAAAAAELVAAPANAVRRARVEAQLAMLRGDDAAALRALQRPELSLLEAVTLAAVHEQADRLAEADQVLAAVAPRLLPAQEPFVCASAHTVRGHVARRRGELAVARAEFEAAAELLFAIGNVRHAASAQLNLGVVGKDLGEHAIAVERLREARTLYQHVGDAVRGAIAAANLGSAALARDDAATARQWLEPAAAELERLGERSASALASAMLARAHARLGDRAAAAAALARVGDTPSARLQEEVARVHALLRAAAAAPALPPMSDRSQTGPSRELFRTFLAVNRQLAQETDLDKAMRHLLDAAVTLTGGRLGYLLVARGDGMRREFQSGDAGPVGQAFSRSLAHRAMSLQRTLTGADGLADRELQDMPSIRNLQVRSAVCAPFRSAGGTVGAIYVEHPGRAGAFADTDKEALEVLADQAAIAVDRMLREEALQSELLAKGRELAVVTRSRPREGSQLLGDSVPMRELRAQIDKLAPLELSVLVLGETGTGKELVARALHERSGRHRGPFVAENCSALPPELMERELFGHVQGAFTGADRDRPGLLELASGGTLFLDEVGDMPPALQSKLLRALQERTIRRVGGSDTVQLDLRVLAATHRDVRAMVQRGEFREDLFFRLAAVELVVPPLRARGDDVVLLAEHFLRVHGAQRGRALRLSPIAAAALRDYRWPGNVRELEHVIARAALLGEGDLVVDLALPRAAVSGGPATVAGAAVPEATEVMTMKEAERRAIVAALQACGGDKAKSARALGISRTALYEKLKRFGLG